MLLIENGYMIDPKSGREGRFDILVEGERIKKIGEGLRESLTPEEKADTELIDASGRIVAPGLVDVHVHFREPGFVYKEDIQSGSLAAARGGVTTVVLMANTKPAVDNQDTLREVLEKGRATQIHVESCANVTYGLKGQELTDMEALAEAGAAGFTDDGIPLMEENIVRRAMETCARLGRPISFHEEDPRLIINNGINQGRVSEYLGIGGSPREAEYTLVARDLQLALETGAQIDIQHISTKEAVELVRQAKKKGSNIHAEACPHHFTLTEDAVIEYGTLAKMNPPLRTEEDRLAIIKGLQDGTIDMIATDHAPHSAEEKKKPLTEAPSGIIGLETALPLAITELYAKGYLSMKQILERMSLAPAQLYQLDAGYLAEGGPADIIIVDTEGKQVFTEFLSKAKNSPFIGRKLQGIVEKTICKGKTIFQ